MSLNVKIFIVERKNLYSFIFFRDREYFITVIMKFNQSQFKFYNNNQQSGYFDFKSLLRIQYKKGVVLSKKLSRLQLYSIQF